MAARRSQTDKFQLLRHDLNEMKNNYFFQRHASLKNIEDELKVIKVELRDTQSKLDQILQRLPG